MASPVISTATLPVKRLRAFDANLTVQLDSARLHGADRTAAWARERAKVRAFAATLIEREQKLVSEHQNDALVHPSVLEAHLAEIVPREAVMVQESSTARTTLLPLGHDVPLGQRYHHRAPLALDQIGDGQVLLLERLLDVTLREPSRPDATAR